MTASAMTSAKDGNQIPPVRTARQTDRASALALEELLAGGLKWPTTTTTSSKQRALRATRELRRRRRPQQPSRGNNYNCAPPPAASAASGGDTIAIAPAEELLRLDSSSCELAKASSGRDEQRWKRHKRLRRRPTSVSGLATTTGAVAATIRSATGKRRDTIGPALSLWPSWPAQIERALCLSRPLAHAEAAGWQLEVRSVGRPAKGKSAGLAWPADQRGLD